MSKLRAGLQALQLTLSEMMQNQLLSYLQLLAKWNRTYNLTAIRDHDEMLIKHVFDSLVVLPYLHGNRIIDVGTGAGLPGLVLAITRPDLHFVLIDSNNKKIRFVNQAIIELSLLNVTAVSMRVEQFKPTELFTTIISRAYSSLALFYQQTSALATIDAHWLAMKGAISTEELAEVVAIPTEVITLQVPQLDAVRTLCVMKK